MFTPSPRHFPSADLARRIAAIYGKKLVTIKVEMVGREDVRKLLTRIRAAQAVPPSSTFRCRLAIRSS